MGHRSENGRDVRQVLPLHSSSDRFKHRPLDVFREDTTDVDKIHELTLGAVDAVKTD